MIYYIYSTNSTLTELEAMIAACLHLDCLMLDKILYN